MPLICDKCFKKADSVTLDLKDGLSKCEACSIGLHKRVKVTSEEKYAHKMQTTTVEAVTTFELYDRLPRKEKKYFISACVDIKLLKELLSNELAKGRQKRLLKRIAKLK